VQGAQSLVRELSNLTNATGGVKEFIVTLHNRFLWDVKEGIMWETRVNASMDSQVLKLNQTLNDTRNAWLVANTSYYLSLEREQNINTSMTFTQTQMEATMAEILKETEKRETVDFNWNRTIGVMESQKKAAEATLQDVEHVIKLLTGPRPLNRIADLLKKRRGPQQKKLNK